MNLRVDCFAGASGAMEPRTVWFGDRPVVVREIVDRWHGADHRWWKVQTDEGSYVLRREERTSAWELAAVVAS